MTISKVDIQNVLIADDDLNVRAIIEMSLTGLTKWKLRIATNGEEALKHAEEQLPDLILLDMMMPDMDGLTAFAELKNRYGASLPAVIFMTAKVQTHEIEQYTKLGAAGVITKPFDPMTLPQQIQSVLDNQ